MVNEIATPLETPPDAGRDSVFSSLRQVDQPPLALRHRYQMQRSLPIKGGIGGYRNLTADQGN